MAKSANPIRPHRDRLVLKSITETPDLVAGGLKPQRVQNWQEMIVRRMGDGRKASKLLKVEDALMISFLNVCVHAVIEILGPIEGGVVGPDHGAQIMHDIAGAEYQHPLVS